MSPPRNRTQPFSAGKGSDLASVLHSFRLPPVKAAAELPSLRFKIGEIQEGRCPGRQSRKRRGKGLSADAFTD